MANGNGKSFKELEAFWYAKLEGFKDIENTALNDRPLLKCHSFVFVSERVQVIKEDTEVYSECIAQFLAHPEIDEICEIMVKHGNCAFKPKQVIEILKLHHGGWTERKIATYFNREKTCVHRTLKKAREWMKVA